MSKTPVFDTGDTLFPTVKFFRKAVKSEIGNFNIFEPKSTEAYFREKGIDISSDNVKQKYIEEVNDYMIDERLNLLQKRSNKFGPIGIISKNWQHAEKVSMDFVLTTEYNNFSTEHQGRKAPKLSFETVREEVTR